jgi:hypothetical protein
MSFELSARNLLGVGTLSGTWSFTARLDADGEARGRPGDIEGDVVASVAAGAAPTRILLDRRVTEVSEPIDVSGPVAHGGMTAASGMPGMSGMSGMDGLPPGHPAIGDGLPAGHPAVGDGGQPYGGLGGPMVGAMGGDGAGGDEGAEPGAGPRIKGTLELGDDFADDNGKLTLFVYLKNNDGERGMPWAALRFDQARFPMALDIGPEDVTLQIENKADLLTAGELWLHARLDLDGNAMTKEPGCIQAEPIKVSADSDPFTLVLDTRRGS